MWGRGTTVHYRIQDPCPCRHSPFQSHPCRNRGLRPKDCRQRSHRLPPPVTQAILEVVPDFFTEAKTKPSSSEVADEEERFNHPDHSAQNINSFAQELRNEFSQTYTATPDNINQFKQNLESIASKEELEHLGLDMATDTITEAEYSDFKDPLKALVHRHFPGLSDNWEDSPRWTTIHDRYWNEETQEYERPPTLGYKRQLAMAQGAIGPENRLERYNRAAHQAEVMLKPVNVWGNGSPNAGVNMMGSASEMGNAERARKEGFSTLISELAMAPIGFGLGRLVPIALRPAFEMTGRGLVGMRYGLKGENKDFGVNGPGLQEGLRSAALIEPPKEKVKAKPPTNESPVLPIETPTAKRPSNIDPPTMPASPPEDDASGQAPITALPVSPVVPNLVLPNTRPPLGQENKPIADKVKQELDLPTSIPISELLPPESETPEPSNRWSWENWGWGNWSWDKELSRAKKFCQNLVPSWAWWR